MYKKISKKAYQKPLRKTGGQIMLHWVVVPAIRHDRLHRCQHLRICDIAILQRRNNRLCDDHEETPRKT